jgi:DNA-binding beta-propeller fold protein YncE
MRVSALAGGLMLLAACQPSTPAPENAEPAAASTQSPMREIALIANAEGATVSLLDVAKREIVATIDINPDKVVVDRPGTANYAQDTDVSPDGKTLYVSRGYMGDVAAFDIASGKPLWVRDMDTVRADHMTLTPDGKWLFVSVLTEARVEKIDAATGEAKGRFVSGVYPHDNQITADGKRVINSSLGNVGVPLAERDSVSAPSDKSGYAYQLTVADVDTLEVLDRIRMPVGMRPWHMMPGEKTFWAQTSNNHAVTEYEFSSGKELRRIDLPVKDGVTAADWDFDAPHHGLALAHDGSALCLAGRASDYAAVVTLGADPVRIETIPTDDAPGWATLSLDDSVCLVPNTRADNVSVISMAEKKEVARVPTGDGPKHVTVALLPAEVVDAAAARR